MMILAIDELGTINEPSDRRDVVTLCDLVQLRRLPLRRGGAPGGTAQNIRR
jgi:hypothetical protein